MSEDETGDVTSGRPPTRRLSGAHGEAVEEETDLLEEAHQGIVTLGKTLCRL